MTWDVPTDQDCPSCGQTMFKRSGKGRMKPFCVNAECSEFLPEDKRGYYKKKTPEENSGEAGAAEEKPAEKKPAEKKATGSRKPAAKKPAGTKKAGVKKTSSAKTPKKQEA